MADSSYDKKNPSALDVKRLSVESRLPSIRIISVFLALITALGCGAYPFFSGRLALWNSGPISNSHRLIAQDCKRCHAEPFAKVRDTECLSCHQLSEHSDKIAVFTKVHPGLSASCGDCHHEHNGDHGLVSKDASFCVSCHASMDKLSRDSKLLNVSDFASHPQFRVNVLNINQESERVSLDNRDGLIDTAAIKLNHAVHLKSGLRRGVNGATNLTTLTCQSCHQLDSDFKRMRPISFDSHCRDCHNLSFDERIPEAQAPHGDAEAIYPALFTAYSKLLITQARPLSDESAESTESLKRLFPAANRDLAPAPLPTDIRSAQLSAREAERQLFTKTGCFLCHAYSEKDPTKQTNSNSHYEIVKPNVPSDWFKAARFSHGAHEEFSCESCHLGVRKSNQTSDILLPGIESCRQCHHQAARPGQVESGCGMCHSYHQALGFPSEKKHNIGEYLRGLMR